MSFGSHMGPTKHKPLRTRESLRFSARNCGLHLGHIFFEKNIQRTEYSFAKQILNVAKFHAVINTLQIVFKNLFCLGLGIVADSQTTRHQKMKIKSGLNFKKMTQCKKKIVLNVSKNKLWKGNLKVLCQKHFMLTL